MSNLNVVPNSKFQRRSTKFSIKNNRLGKEGMALKAEANAKFGLKMQRSEFH
jgi:hypothetical protein